MGVMQMPKRIEIAVPEAMKVEAEAKMKSTGFITRSQKPAWGEWVRHLIRRELYEND